MKKCIIILILISSIVSYSQKITRGPDIGEIYFLGPTFTGTGIYHSVDFGVTAACVDSISTSSNTIEAITADKSPGSLYFSTMGEALYYSGNFGQYGSWQLQSGGISYRICSGRNEGEIFNTISSHSTNYGLSFINHSLNGYFGNLLETEIDNEFLNGYAIVFKSGVVDSIFLLATQDNYETIQSQNAFYVDVYSNVKITRGFNNGEIFIYLAQDANTDNLLLRSNNFGQAFDTIEELNLNNFYQLDFEGGRQEGEIYILYNFVNLMWLNAHIYLFHSIDFGKTFEVFHPFSKGNEPVLANFSTIEKEVLLTTPVEFSNFSIGNIQEYQWDFENDGIIDSYEEFPTHFYQDTGYYSVKLSVVGQDSTNTFIKENYIHVIDTITSNPELKYQELNIFPNPFYDKFSIEIKPEFKRIEIYDLNGKNHFSKTLAGENKNETIDLRELEKGIYILKIRTEGQDITKKIIKI